MLFTREQSNALIKSIEKWEGILYNGKIDNGYKDCSCCESFMENTEDGFCTACPIYQYTKNQYCVKTPYDSWVDHHRDIHKDTHYMRVLCPACITIAQKEIKFLKNLCMKTILLRKLDH